MAGFDPGPGLIGIVLLYLGYRMLKMFDRAGSKEMYCATCGATGKPKTRTKGSILIELVLWLMFIVPGLIYSIWRLSTRAQVCSNCGATGIIPIGSPVVRRSLASNQTPAPDKSGQSQPTYIWPATKTVALEVVGESKYQSALRKLARDDADLTAHLIPEPLNPYDSNAVRIAINSLTVGYLARDDAEDFGRLLQERGLAGRVTSCSAWLTGGHELSNGEMASYGVELDLDPYE